MLNQIFYQSTARRVHLRLPLPNLLLPVYRRSGDLPASPEEIESLPAHPAERINVPVQKINAAFTDPMLLLSTRELPEGVNWGI